jgi:hypothetical protein
MADPSEVIEGIEVIEVMQRAHRRPFFLKDPVVLIVEASTPGIDQDTDQFIPAAEDITARVTQAAFPTAAAASKDHANE